MKYLGWIVSLLLIIVFFITYRTKYVPLAKDIANLEKEIAMWENILKGEKGLTQDRNNFPPERFFEDNKLTPYAEVEILRRFDMMNKGLELYISGPKALDRATDVMRFLSDQRIVYKELSCFVVIDSTELFQYRFIK